MTSKVVDFQSRLEAAISVPVPFAFEGQQMRVVWRHGEPWFIAADVCAVLGLVNPSKAVSALDADEKMTLTSSEGHSAMGTRTSAANKDEKGTHSVGTLGGKRGGARSYNVVSESGLYTLILRCRGATTPGTLPHRFRRWVTGEVLPSLRRTGQYAMPKPRKPKAAPARDHQLHAVDRAWWNAQLARTNLSQRKIAILIGMDHAALSLALNGKRHLRFQEALALADNLGITVDELRARLHLPQPRNAALSNTEDAKTLIRAVASIADTLTQLVPVLMAQLRTT